MKNIKVQGWDVNLDENIVEIEIKNTDIAYMCINSRKSVKYSDLIDAGSEYPAVILEKKDGYYAIIDGAHRIKALMISKIKTVKAYLVISHNN